MPFAKESRQDDYCLDKYLLNEYKSPCCVVCQLPLYRNAVMPFVVPRSGRVRLGVAYVILLLAGIGVFMLIRSFGEGLSSRPVPTSLEQKAVARVEVLPHVLLALVVIIVTARLVGAAFRRLAQPPVIGEVLAGILLGPSFLGAIAPTVRETLLRSETLAHLAVLAQLGVILYLFLVGLELDTALLGRHGHEAVAISHASILVPFLLGAALALGVYPILAPAKVSFTVFALFLGVAMAITAFPVLARILTDRGLARTPLGNLALTCAAIGDATAWCLLAVLVGIARSRLDEAVYTVLWTAAFFLAMVLVVRPLLFRWLRRQREELTQGTIAVLLLGVLVSAWTTERIGIHALFGAFLFGALLPHESRVARQMDERLRDVVQVLFLPAYFAFTGMRTHIGLVSTLEQWLLCALILFVATLGKVGGTLAAARYVGLPWREASALGVLMNTRGLMELVVLNIGLDLGVISPTLFTMMVLMAVITTLATAPILHWLGIRAPTNDTAASEAGPRRTMKSAP